MSINIQIKLTDGGTTPNRASEHAAGYDIQTIDAGIVPAFGVRSFRTGVSIAIPQGYVGKVYSRSGHGFKHQVRLVNCTGIIDADYRGEILVKLSNDSGRDFVIEKGMRVAQIIFEKFETADFETVESLPETVRGEAGFGSTG